MKLGFPSRQGQVSHRGKDGRFLMDWRHSPLLHLPRDCVALPVLGPPSHLCHHTRPVMTPCYAHKSGLLEGSLRRRLTEVILDPQGMAERRAEEQDFCATGRRARGLGKGTQGDNFLESDRCFHFLICLIIHSKFTK